jgi:uncharacterized FAD-dependent dehydrogenase
MSETHYDAVIVGAGPAGVFAAAELVERGKKVFIADKGRLISDRKCPIVNGQVKSCVNCASCAIVSGWGGAGSASDGKLTLTTGFGGNLEEYIGRGALLSLIEFVDSVFVRFGADPHYYEAGGEMAHDTIRRGAQVGLRVLPARIRHIGTDASREVLNNMYEDLVTKCDIRMEAPVEDISIEGGRAAGICLADGTEVRGKNVLVTQAGRERRGSKKSSASSSCPSRPCPSISACAWRCPTAFASP